HCVDVAPLRSRLAEGPHATFPALVAALRGQVFSAHDHGGYPFSRLVRALAVPHDASRSPLVNAIFNLDHELPLSQAGGLTVRGALPAIHHAKFDLAVHVLEAEDGLLLDLDYATALFDEATVARLLAQLGTLLDGAIALPGAALADLPLLSAAESAQVLDEWSGRTVLSRHEGEGCIHELVAAHARRSPGAVALDSADGVVTYGELELAANRLANHLRALGVAAEARVGIALRRSPDLIVALLAVLKAGGAYLPLDPDYPRERLELMVEDAGAAVVVTASDAQDALPAWTVVRVVVDEEREAIEQAGDAAPANDATPDSLAYVLYTSGSTGRPKGVAVPHRGVVRLVRDASFARLDESATLVQLSPVAFDASTLEIWGALSNGGRLVLPPPGPLSPAELAAAALRSGVTTLWLTSALFQQMVAEPALVAKLRGVRQLLAGGDVVPPAAARACLAALPETRLVNGYGPTENTTFTCTFALAGSAAERLAGAVPIGRPIRGTEVYVRDRELRPVPPGATGYLYAGGEGLARGYHDRPELTAERFLPSPFGPAGARLYDTGDLVRFLADGDVDFLGRAAGQVTGRGFRLARGEVEAALAGHPALREAVVVAPGEERLVAFVVPRGESSPEPAALREWL
ncbi:MAG TPA: amino acid adenylation domain-containing protein, partial [Thermoanaerobaculia bacterium]